MKYSLDKYKYFIAKTEDGTPYQVVAVSTYAGKIVRGVSKLTPGDEFDEVKGKKLAAARCNEKIARKRLARATAKIKEAEKAYQKEIAWYNRMVDYYNDSFEAVEEAVKMVKELEENM